VGESSSTSGPKSGKKREGKKEQPWKRECPRKKGVASWYREEVSIKDRTRKGKTLKKGRLERPDLNHTKREREKSGKT